MNTPTIRADEPFAAEFWEDAWDGLHQSSFLQVSQKNHPERWRLFYEEAGPLLGAVNGISESQGLDVVRALIRDEVIGSGQAAMDLGCGTGWLTFPLAAKGVSVLAVDQSRSMLGVVQDAVVSRKLINVTTFEGCWTGLRLPEPCDLALAAFFPEVLSPGGFKRMESLGRRCAVILGSGGQALPWTGLLWRELFGYVPAGAGHQTQAAFNWLMVANRHPNLRQMTLNSCVNLPLAALLSFYRSYFAMFDRAGRSVDALIQEVLTPFSQDGRVTARGTTRIALIWWTAPETNYCDDRVPA